MPVTLLDTLLNLSMSDANDFTLPGFHVKQHCRYGYQGSSWENGYNERFNGTLRREGLNAEWFTTTEQAKIVINHWLGQYNHTRSHQALDMRRPVQETLLVKARISGPYTGGERLRYSERLSPSNSL